MDDIEIKIWLEAQSCNGLLGLKINDSPISLIEGQNELYLRCPSGILNIESYGKDMYRDTELINGTIIKDKHLRITEIHLAGIRFIKHDINDLLFNPYIGENKKIEILIPEKNNIVRWYLRKKEDFYANQQK